MKLVFLLKYNRQWPRCRLECSKTVLDRIDVQYWTNVRIRTTYLVHLNCSYDLFFEALYGVT